MRCVRLESLIFFQPLVDNGGTGSTSSSDAPFFAPAVAAKSED